LELPNLYGTKMFQFQQRLKHLKAKLKKWNKEFFGNIFEEKMCLELETEANQLEATSGGENEGINIREEKLKIELDKRDKQEEVLWKQN
jgi:hypothetical protein